MHYLPHIHVSGSLDTWKTATDLAVNVFTIGAIVVGAIWAYWRFARERTRWPRATLELVTTHRSLKDNQAILSVKVKVHNAGLGLMKLSQLRVDISQVLPIEENEIKKLKAGQLTKGDEHEADWPCIEQYKKTWLNAAPEIEPQENDEFVHDFVVRDDLETVFVYAYIQNVSKRTKKGELGWPITTFYDLTSPANHQATASVVSDQ